MRYLVCIVAFSMLLSCKKSSNTPVTPKVIAQLATDGTNQGPVLQHYIDSMNALGGGIVEIAAGTYIIGPINMRSKVTLQLDTLAILTADTVMSAFTVNGKLADLIGASSCVDIAIIGKGVIDGHGAPWWAAFNANNSISRPRLLYFSKCTGVKLDGITLQNSPSFHFVPSQCDSVTVNNIHIYAPANSPNTDGIDPANSNNVTITNCTIDDGDDCIAVKAGRVSSNLGYPTTNITITGCTFLHGHGLSLGSEVDCGISDLKVDNCTFNGTQNGIRLKSNIGLGGLMTNLSYTNITMTNVSTPMVVDFIYSSNSGSNLTDVPSVTNMTIDHLTATGASNAGSLIGLAGSTNSISNITLSNLNISAQTGLVLSNASNVTMSNYVINVQSGLSVIASNTIGGIGY